MSTPRTLGKLIELLEKRDLMRALPKFDGLGEQEVDDFLCDSVQVPDPKEICYAMVSRADVDRIVVLCGVVSHVHLTAKDAARLRSRVCETRSCTMLQANAMTLNQVADVIEQSVAANKTDEGKGATKPRGKPGRKSNPESDQQIHEEYNSGLEDGKWDGQADYLRKKHRERWKEDSNAAKSWLSTLLKRVQGTLKQFDGD